MWGSLTQHLTELRARLILVLIAWGALWVVGWFIHPTVLDWLVALWCSHQFGATANAPIGEAASCEVATLRLTGGVSARFRVAAIPAILGGVPMLLWQAWRFGAGRAEDAQRTQIRLRPWSWVGWGLMSLWGTSIGLTVLLAHPLLNILVALGQPWVVPIITLEGILSALVWLFIAVLVMLVVPMGVGAGLYAGLLTTTHLHQARPVVVLGSLIVAALLTPTTDPATMVLVALWPIGAIEAMRLLGCMLARWRARRAMG